MNIPTDWTDFEVIDAGGEEKLERWGNYILRRPDPQAIWEKNPNLKNEWENPDMFYHRSDKGGGYWEMNNKRVPESWVVNYKDLKFKIKPTGFKHTGLFPEQAVNWEWIMEKVRNSKVEIPKVLNLFAYTGGASVAAAFAGAEVTHVDASKGMNMVGKENIDLSGLTNRTVRFIQDDVLKFVEREMRRGNKYHLIIMDPPTYGRGSKGELWEIERDLEPLVEKCSELLDDSAFGFIVNTYATEISTTSFENILKIHIQSKLKGNTESGELGLPISTKRDGIELVLPTGMFARWNK
jgi:23S rRNA (cytosine1962-C5)-methyltransferase